MHAAIASLAGKGTRRHARRPRICLVSSVGGHFRELLQLRSIYERYDHFYVVNDRMDPPPEIRQRMIFIRHIEREWRQVLGFLDALQLLRKQRPNLIISTGAAPAVMFAIAGRLLGIPLLYVEPASAIERPTLTGRLLYNLHLASLFLYQWPSLYRHYPRAIYGGCSL
jgi:hypothetical protein